MVVNDEIPNWPQPDLCIKIVEAAVCKVVIFVPLQALHTGKKAVEKNQF